MSELEAYLSQLAKAHGFTLEELEVNRQGKVHPRQLQRAKGVAGVVTTFLFTVLSVVGGSVGAFLFYEDTLKPLSRIDRNGLVGIFGATVVVSLVFFASFVSAVKRRRRTVEAFQRGAVIALEGPITKRWVDGRRTGSSWSLTLGDRRFSVGRDTWELVTNGASYRLYVVDGRVVSFEPRAR